MLAYPNELDVYILAGVFIYIHALYMRATEQRDYGESAQMHRLPIASAARQCDKYQHLMSRLVPYEYISLGWVWSFLYKLNHTSYAISNWTLNITYIVSSIVTQFYQKLKRLFMKMKVELHLSIIFFKS